MVKEQRLEKKGNETEEAKGNQKKQDCKKKGKVGGVTGQKLKTKKKGQEEELRSRIRKKKIKEEAEGERG